MKAKELKEFFNSLTEQQLNQDVYINYIDKCIKGIEYVEIIDQEYVLGEEGVERLSEIDNPDNYSPCPKQWLIGNIHIVIY